MGRISNYPHQPVFDNNDNPNNDNNTSCLESKPYINDDNLTFDYVKKKIRILQNSIENDLSELSLQTSGLNKSDDLNFDSNNLKNNTHESINWNKINRIKMKIESDISIASSYLNKVKANLTPADHVQVMRYSEIFDQYRKDYNLIISNAEKYNGNILIPNEINSYDDILSKDGLNLHFEHNKALKNSVYDIESLTSEALSILNTSKRSNEKFIQIRNKMYSIIDMHLPNIDMIQKNITHVAVKHQRIIAGTIATCLFILTITLLK